jgi:hypothetical protein
VADPGPARCGSSVCVSKGKEVDNEDTEEEEEEEEELQFMTPKRKWKSVDGPVDGPASSGSAELKVNRHGISCLKNGVVALKALALSDKVSKKQHWPEALTLNCAKLLWGQSFTLFSLIVFGKDLPTEKVRNDEERTAIMLSAAPYALSDEQLSALEDAHPQELMQYLQGMVKAAQQSLKYLLYAKVNQFFNDYVFTRPGVYPSTDIRIHLGLTGVHADKSFMDL